MATPHPRTAAAAPKPELPSSPPAAPFEAFRLTKPRVSPPRAAAKAEDAPADVARPAKRKRVVETTVRSASACPPPSAFAVYAEPRSPLPAVPASLATLPPPFVAAAPGLWRERFAACCKHCFVASAPCAHHAERQLRLLVVGHNPSDTAWRTGFPYANGTNRFWKLMAMAALVPPGFAAMDADAAPALLGLGITDVGCDPGSDAGEFKRGVMRQWRGQLYDRLQAHCARCAAWAAQRNGTAGAEDTAKGSGSTAGHVAEAASLAAHAPQVIAFSGKRQWCELFEPPLKRVAAGLRPAAERPPGWPAALACCEVWVLPSSSGRAVMTREEREGPYRALGERIAQLPWLLA